LDLLLDHMHQFLIILEVIMRISPEAVRLEKWKFKHVNSIDRKVPFSARI
jgi:hypothetical protein